jgi:PKD repeat protein
MKKISVFILILILSVVNLYGEDCIIKIYYAINKTNPVSYTFKSDYSGTSAKYYWYFGDAGTSDNPTPTFTFKTTNTYQIKLKVVDTSGKICIGTLTEKFEGTTSTTTTVNSTCKIELTAKQVSEVAYKFQFNCSSSTTMKTFKWTFGDGQTATTKEPLIAFSNPGTYEVTCTASNAEGCTTSATIKVVAAPIVMSGKGKVKTSDAAGCGLLILMESGITLQPVEIVPNFLLKEGQYVELAYEYSTKTTTCTIGKPAKITKIAEIAVAACKAYFTTKKASETDPVLAKKVIVTNASTGTIRELKWSFGDGSTSTQVTTSIEHIYKEFGTYNICLTIATTSNCTSEYCTSITLKNPSTSSPTATDTKTPTTCAFEISAKPKTEASNIIQFNSVSSVTLNYWSWSFGDGQVASVKEPLITYKSPGTYEVTCTVKTAAGCTTSRTIKVTVGSVSSLSICKEPIVLTLYDPDAGKCNGKAMARIVDANNNELTGAEYQWSTGKTGNTADGLCADKSYNVQVLVKGVCQKGATFTFQAKPVWKVTTTTDGKYGFTVVDPLNGLNYVWDLGDGSSATGSSVFHSYSKEGIYTVKLSVEGNGTSDNSEQAVNVSNTNKSLTYTGSFSGNQIKVYPNPAQEQIWVDLGTETSGKLLIEAVNLKGKKVLSQQLFGTGHTIVNLDIHHLMSGIYVLKVTDENFVIQTEKFVIK